MGIKNLLRRTKKHVCLSDEIDKFLIKSESLPNNRDKNFHVSEFAGYCVRELVINKLIPTKPRKNSPDLIRTFNFGTALHDWYQNKYLGPMGILWGKWECSRCGFIHWGFMPKDRHECDSALKQNSCIHCLEKGRIELRGGCIHCGLWGQWIYREIPVVKRFDEYNISFVGHCDGLIKLYNQWFVVELKSMRDPIFLQLDGARYNHSCQGKTYGYLIRSGCVEGLPCDIAIPKPSKVIVFYIGKNCSKEKEYSLNLDDFESEFFTNVPLIFYLSLQRKILPPKWEECTKRSDSIPQKCKKASHCFADRSWDHMVDIGNKRRKKWGMTVIV